MAVTALAMASFCLPAFRYLVPSDRLRTLWCVAVVCLPIEEHIPPVALHEVLGTPANVGWWVAIWLSLASLMRMPRARAPLAGLSLLGALAIFTTPLAAVNLPLWLLRLWHGLRRRRLPDVVFALALLASFALLTIAYGRIGTHQGPLAFPVLSRPLGYLQFVGGLIARRVSGMVLPPGPLAALDSLGMAAVAMVAGLGRPPASLPVTRRLGDEVVAAGASAEVCLVSRDASAPRIAHEPGRPPDRLHAASR